MRLHQIIALFASSLFASCEAYSTGEAIVKQYVEEVWNQKKLDALEKYIEPNYVRSCAVFPKLEEYEKKQCCPQSLERMKESLKRMFESVPNLQVKLSDIVAEGNNVYVTAISKGTEMKSPWGSASGKHFESKCAIHHRISETSGKIAFTEVFCDFSGMLQHFAPSPLTIDSNPETTGVSQLLLGGRRNQGGITLDNINSGMEKIIAQRIMNLADNYLHQSKTELVQLHDSKFKSISPAFPETQGGADRSREIDFNLGFMKCMSSSNVKAQYNVQRFYFEDKAHNGGVTVSWEMHGVFASKCPAPYDKFTPTNKPFTLTGVSYHRFNQNGLLEEKVVMYDNEYVNNVLKGATPSMERMEL